jgi:pimeloyl-ACP methyl ester carboxylesterase
VRRIRYRAHNGEARDAYVLLPSWYGPKNDPPLPLIISPHGRGLSGRANAALWGDLPARGPFAVVSPDGQGRRLPLHSWGFTGQIEDLAKMPSIVARALPWMRVDRSQIYAFGGSMGGQETLLLLARHPRLLAGAAAFDAVTDLALQYRHFPQLPCNLSCRRRRGLPRGLGVQRLAQLEIGGSPRTAPVAYAVRSPMTYARRIAFSCVPLELWYSVADRVIEQRRQSRKLLWEIRRLNPRAPVDTFAGFWIHSAEMRARYRLPLALATFGLLAEEIQPPSGLRVVPAPVVGDCTRAR